jgi:hypothetical protein
MGVFSKVTKHLKNGFAFRRSLMMLLKKNGMILCVATEKGLSGILNRTSILPGEI